MKSLCKVQLLSVLSAAVGCVPLTLEALQEADPLHLSLCGLWIGLSLCLALVCTLLDTLSD